MMNSKVFNIERLSGSEQTLTYSAMVIENHSLFKGHFPHAPVVPGVCTMSMIKDCLADALVRPVRYSQIKECKFLAAIIPSEHKIMEVNITINQHDAEYFEITAEVVSSGIKMMKLKATLA